MTGFDIGVLAVIALSTVLAFVRGIVREAIALASWVAAFVLAFAWGDRVTAMLPPFEAAPAARPVLACVLIFVVVLAAGALVAFVLAKALRAIGLGFLDRFLGAAFGAARGLAIALLFVLVAGLTALPRQDWWQNALLAPALATAALALRPWLPATWAERLDYSRAGRRPVRPGAAAAAAPTGEALRCAES
jgi:membrane protein required for colicin V production